MTFNSLSDFNDWLDSEEQRSKNTFIKPRGKKQLSSYATSTYLCSRSGQFVSKSTRKRQLKSQGSKKIGHQCTAQIILKEYKDHVTVSYFKEHYEHDHLLGHLPVPEDIKQAIADELVPGEEDKSRNIPFITYLSEGQNLDIASDFSDSCSSPEIDVSESNLENVFSSILLESNRKEVALLRGKLDSILSANQKESILLESNKQEMALLSEKLNSISSMDKKASVQIKYYLNAIEHLIEVQAATTTDSELSN